ncbi:AAA family ATPase [Aerosakkonema sp. BLCC-F183]|uniref:trifunctional serine/threonine-protein kinase/ATP-binding protein/sensor histidine kinase n=1 Tax=Aerosakkonema sp. BLCC-F183 TaxID=3342834 RepID=UPI0035BB59C1
MNAIANLPGYEITKHLYTGTRTLVYRGIRIADQQRVAIKLLRNEYPNFNEVVQFRNQYTIAKNLNFTRIIKTLALEVYGNAYALVMEEFGGISLSNYLQNITDESYKYKYLCLTDFFGIAIQLTETLHYLYQNRVIHKDIKPANILINCDSKEVKLIDFSISSLLPRETQEIQNANALEGTLAYLSPEQTGRMNRGIDYRSDFYSLGVTFYELLTRKLPFTSEDPMELVHCHLAKQPMPIHQINSEIPLILSRVVSKLMEKNAENRYQSALGIKHDLEKCLTQLQKKGEIEYFEIGQRDICDRFIIPEKLYGREAEVQQLLEAFERISGNTNDNPKSELALVAGFSGIGKTAVVNEVHKPIVRQRGYFIKGKYDQFQRNIPFSAFVQAFRDLMSQLLSESNAQIQNWKSQILSAVRDNGQVLIEVIPELENIIGKQPPAIELSGTAAQNRFNLLFQNFVQVFTAKEHPFVIFLDDLQWADSASLNLLKLLMQDTEHLLILGAYRDNEVSPSHPFILTVDEILKTGATVNTITLPPLSEPDLNRLVADTLNCESSLAQPLTKLVYQKTKGNPFFATQFLKALHDDKLISFDWDIQHWQCDIAQVNALALTDDVVEFMALQLQKLPKETQDILKLAACIGAQFDLNTLAIVSENSRESTATALWKALQEGLAIPTTKIYKLFTQSDSNEIFKAPANPTYRFLHDRVQQAAYSLITETEKPYNHLKIGQLLLSEFPPKQHEEKLFAIVNQLNKGRQLLKEKNQRQELAELNLRAGIKAKNATAYSAALEYFKIGNKLLVDNRWQQQYNLTLALTVAAAESAYLQADFEEMERWAENVLKNAASLLDRIAIYKVKILAFMAQNQPLRSIETALETLASLGVNIPPSPTPADIHKVMSETQSLYEEKSFEELINLTLMIDAEKQAAQEILCLVTPPAVIAKPALFPLIICQQVTLSLEYGNSRFSSFAYVHYGMMLCGLPNIEFGYQCGQLALALLERFQAKELEAKVLGTFYAFIAIWKRHVRETVSEFLKTYRSGLETGDVEFSGYSATWYCLNSFWIGSHLPELEQEMSIYSDFCRQIKSVPAVLKNEMLRQAVINLIVNVEHPHCLRGEVYDTEIMIPVHQQAGDIAAIGLAYTYQLMLCYIFEKFSQAVENANLGQEYLDNFPPIVFLPIFHFYSGLARLALYKKVTDSEGEAILQQVASHQEKMKLWAHHAPMNFQHKYDLVEAEKSRVLGQKAEAIEMYEKAISGAKENGYIQEEALANELAAKFYLAWGKEKVATWYMQEAYYCYARWGAKAKTNQLERCYPQLLRSIQQKSQQLLSIPQTITTIDRAIDNNHDTRLDRTTSTSEILDLTTILKACQAISSEIQHDRLLAKLTQVLMENAGATKCALILPSDDQWQIEALATFAEAEEIIYLNSQPLETTNELPISLVHYVANTSETLVFDEITKQKRWSSDRYIKNNPPKSVLCLPILKQSTLIAILYLENNHTAAAFTLHQQEIIKLLSTQISISIENASLYRNLEKQVEKRTAQLKASEAKLQEAHKLARLGNWEWDLMTNQLYWSDEIYKIFGLEKQPQDTLFEKHREQIHPEDFQTWLTGLELLQREGKPYDFDFRIIDINGKVRYIYAKGQAEKNADGKVVKLFGTAQDISDRKLIEEALRSSERELREKATQLEQTLQELRQTQSQLIHTEKMSSLGEIVAGVAHEINNPVSFIYGNIEPASQYVNDLLDLIHGYQNSYPTSTPEIEEKIAELDLDFLVEDLLKLLGSMKNGAKRIRDIVASLRNFSRLDESEIKAVDIHEGIEATLLILQYRLHGFQEKNPTVKLPEIAVIKNYGKLPLIVCYPNQLNQVFLNILNNAIDALHQVRIHEVNSNFTPTITITTAIPEDGFIEIKIADNGVGIPPEIVKRIFEPFFTTKPMGSGTGLGLYVSYQIVVDRHRGTLSCVSNLGVGTEFIIKMPIDLK